MQQTFKRLIIASGAALTAVATGLSTPAFAEDIDIFQSIRGDEPALNLLFLIDNTANWGANLPLNEGGSSSSSSKREIEHEVLRRIFSEEKYHGRLNVGFMVFSDENPNGGKLILPPKKLTADYANQLATYFGHGVTNDKKGLPKGNNAAYALILEEALRLYGTEEPLSGKDTGKGNAIQPGEGAFNGQGRYNRPPRNACYDYVIMIANGEPDNGENAGNAPNEALAARGGDTTQIELEFSNFENIVADEFARHMGTVDIDDTKDGIQTLPIQVLDVYDPGAATPDDPFAGLNNKERGARSLMRSIAEQSGGTYAPATSAAKLEEEIRAILERLTSIDSIFAAASLPVSVNTRGTHLNQFYVGVFRPNERNSTQWNGNLKKYRIGGGDNNDVFITDREGTPALDESTGFVKYGAKSFWTGESQFWSFEPTGRPPSASDLPDGPLVEKGGVAQYLRQLGDRTSPPDGNAEGNKDYSTFRNIYTCTGCASGDALELTPFANNNPKLVRNRFGLATDDDTDNLINWVRGEDNYVDSDNFAADEDEDGLRNDARASLHGDVLHSQPSIVNYSDGDDPDEADLVIFYGANDGMLHAVRGGESGGQELWTFVPEELFKRLPALRANVPGKKYFVDGDMTTFIVDENRDGFVNGDDQVLLFATMRRGGRFLYAFDVTTPETPKYLWRSSNLRDGFDELGQTWSDVRVGYVEGIDAPVAVFGGGYAPDTDDSNNGNPATEGRGLFMVNALTGDLIWQVGPEPDSSGGGDTLTESRMTHSMPAAPTLIDFNSDGFLDRIYIPDTGGQVWRINLSANAEGGSADPSQWTSTLLASFGSDQKFLEAVDVVAKRTTSLEEGYEAILLGSGDREDPFNRTTVNRFYMIKDRGEDDPAFTVADLFDATSNVIQDGNDDEKSAAITTLNESDGWYITLTNPGEKVVTGSATATGATFFNTNEPPPPPQAGFIDCASEQGTARGYAVSFEDGSAVIEQDDSAGLDRNDRTTEYAGGGFPPTPTIFLVEIDGEQYLGAASGFFDRDLDYFPLHIRERTFYMNDRIDK